MPTRLMNYGRTLDEGDHGSMGATKAKLSVTGVSGRTSGPKRYFREAPV